jgi:hypothetical protein
MQLEKAWTQQVFLRVSMERIVSSGRDSQRNQLAQKLNYIKFINYLISVLRFDSTVSPTQAAANLDSSSIGI